MLPVGMLRKRKQHLAGALKIRGFKSLGIFKKARGAPFMGVLIPHYTRKSCELAEC